MNPVKTGACHFGKLAAVNQGLELLDLFNTGLCDSGIQAFRDGLAAHGGSTTLKHLYLSVNDISDGAVVAEIVDLLPNLESLFLGVNLLGDAGAALVLRSLLNHATLARLEFGANGLTDASLPLLLSVVETCPQLRALTLGSYKSTSYFVGQHNRFTDTEGLIRIVQQVDYLGLDGSVENVDFSKLEQGLLLNAPQTIVYATQSSSMPGAKKRSLHLFGETTAKKEGEKRRQLLHPRPFVDHIESIYRNQM